jgi:hypothetical protein
MQEYYIVIPCYNEEKRIDLKRYREFIENEPDAKLLFDGIHIDSVKIKPTAVLKNTCQKNVQGVVVCVNLSEL